MFKTILVHVDADDPGNADRIRCAAHLAHEFHATLIGAAAGMPEAAVEVFAAGAATFAGGIVTGNVREMTKEFAAARAEFDRWTSGFVTDTGWRSAVEFPATALVDMAGIADLIVVGSHMGSHLFSSTRAVDHGALVMSAGRPVLTVPRGIGKIHPANAVVAWKNTREARRALADALPLLAVMDRVTLLHVRETGDEDDGSLVDAKAFLDRHCIGAEMQKLEFGDGSVADRLVDVARRTESSLIVAGAYGHTRIREWAFGGVTRDLLESCPIPCLFSR